jgi:hypothetical protein
MDSKTVLRAGIGRTFSKVTVVSGSGHFAGFIGQYDFQNANQGVTPTFKLDEGLPPYALPPQINPSFQNNLNVDHWQLSDAARAPENWNWTLSIQRQISSSTVFEAAYNAAIGVKLQTGLIMLNQVPTAFLNDYIARFGGQGAINLLNSQANSAQAVAAGVRIPYANFTNPSVQRIRTVAQALRPYPQYQNVVTGTQGGDKSGHSSYHAMVLKLERRFSQGLTFQWNYTLSKILTDADNYDASSSGAMDFYNRGLEKSIGRFDQTHAAKFSTIYELPVGKGRKFLNTGGVADVILGGWRVGGILTYFSGFPVGLARNNPFPIFNGGTRPVIDTYENWRAPIQGDKFDPAVDRFMVRSNFPVQPVDRFGNATRLNPKVREFPTFNENLSIAKTFSVTERVRVDFRWELFNMFNRTVFGIGNTNLNSNVFGVVNNQANDPRQMQAALKLYW